MVCDYVLFGPFRFLFRSFSVPFRSFSVPFRSFSVLFGPFRSFSVFIPTHAHLVNLLVNSTCLFSINNVKLLPSYIKLLEVQIKSGLRCCWLVKTIIISELIHRYGTVRYTLAIDALSINYFKILHTSKL